MCTVASSAPGAASYGQGTGDIFLDLLGCAGTESRLIDCFHRGLGIERCTHSQDAGAVCVGEC